MKISIESAERIKLIPDTEHEKENLDALEKILIRCDEDSKVLFPVGAYLPGKDGGNITRRTHDRPDCTVPILYRSKNTVKPDWPVGKMYASRECDVLPFDIT